MRLTLTNRAVQVLDDFEGLRVWLKPNFKSVYAIGVDVAEGVNKDASVAAVLDCRSGAHVASFWSKNIDLNSFSQEIYKLGHWYNKAHICIEVNNHGNAVIANMIGGMNGLGYPNLYRRMEFDQMVQKMTTVVGFKTGKTTKGGLIANLNTALKTGKILTYDRNTIEELGSFVKDEKNGKLGAKGMAHDDRVIALALAYEQMRNIHLGSEEEGESTPDIQYDPQTGFPLRVNETDSFNDEIPT